MVVRRFLGVLTAAVIALGVLTAQAVQAATLITVVASGTITDSSEPSLIGTTSTIEQRFRVNPATLFPDPVFAVALFDVLQATITTDGGTDVIDSSGASSAGGIYAISKLDTVGGVPASISAQSSFGIFGGTLLINASIQSDTDDFVPSTDLFQNFVFPPFPANATVTFGLSLEDGNGGVLLSYFVDRVASLTVTVREIADVPAPAALGLFAFGLVGLLALRRRIPSA
jgi:hypothetical protein